jgi:broad specificity phosphatase PhoE
MLVVVRHGRTAWNAERRFQGWADVPLDEEGRRQAEDVASALAKEIRGPVSVVSSDLRRATGTAAAIATALGTTVNEARDLREVDVGRWEGLTQAEAMYLFPDEYRRWSDGMDVRRGGGETLSQAGERVAGCVRDLLGATTGHLVVVGHGMSLQAALRVLAGWGTVRLTHGAPHLGNAEHLVLTDLGHDQAERLISER